jgi:hypothetical protein
MQALPYTAEEGRLSLALGNRASPEPTAAAARRLVLVHSGRLTLDL